MPNRIRMYTLSTCSHCKAAKQFMQNKGINFEFIDVDLLRGDEREDILQEVIKYNPHRSFPTIVIGNKIIIGFKENDILEALNL